MQTESDRHFADELLEKYAIGHLSDDETAPLEEHLLMCSECQVRLTGIDEYLQAAKAAAAGLDREKVVGKQPAAGLFERFWPVPKFVWAAGLATLLVALVVPWQHQQERTTELALSAIRGSDARFSTHAGANDKISLRIGVAKIAASPVYQLQLVDANGRQVWSTGATPQNSEIVALLPHKLSKGQYWVRIYSPKDAANPLQEYGFTVD